GGVPRNPRLLGGLVGPAAAFATCRSTSLNGGGGLTGLRFCSCSTAARAASTARCTASMTSVLSSLADLGMLGPFCAPQRTRHDSWRVRTRISGDGQNGPGGSLPDL